MSSQSPPAPPAPPPERSEALASAPDAGRGKRALLAVVLGLVTLLLYAQTSSFDFVNIDDASYVYQNPIVEQGLTLDGLRYAFAGEHSANWHPVTTLSHLVDVELFGLDAGRHHLTSAVLHALNAALCFFAIFALSRRTWASFLVAALFALHPLRAESVAWISERKDLLSGTFFFLTLIGWTRVRNGGGIAWHVTTALVLALGLMSKQMLITVPFLLLVLELFPLSRGDRAPRPLRTTLVDLAPLFVLALLAVVPMWFAQSSGGTIGTLSALPITDRVANAFAAYLEYVKQSFVPSGLACFYPHPAIVRPDATAARLAAGAIGAAFVLIVSLLVLWRAKRTPLLAAGWLWYLGMLVPVIGLVQIGSQSHADRYTYLPTIGLALMLVALFDELGRVRPAVAALAPGLSALALAVLGFLAWKQIGTWESSETLNLHALEVTELNYVAHNNLGLYRLEDELDPVRAETEFRRALEINPGFREAAFNLALAFNGQGRGGQAETLLESILAADPTFTRAAARLAAMQRNRGDASGALESWQRVTESDPSNARAWLALAELWLDADDPIRAEEAAERALALDDTVARTYIVLGRAAASLGDLALAFENLARAVEVEPDSFEAHYRYARQLADGARIEEAKSEAKLALEIDDTSTDARILLAKLYLFEGNEPSARRELDIALEEAPDHAEANDLLGNLLLNEGKVDEAEKAFLRALSSAPDYDSALHNLGVLYEDNDREAEALELYRRLLDDDVDSGFADGAARGIAWILATSPDAELRDGAEAVRWAQFSLLKSPDPNDPGPHIVLAAAFAEDARFEEAVASARVAVELARNEKQRAALQRRLELYESGSAFHRNR